MGDQTAHSGDGNNWNVHALLVQSNSAIAGLIGAVWRSGLGGQSSLEVVETIDTACECLDGVAFDLVMVDIGTDETGRMLESLRRVLGSTSAPVVVIAGGLPRETALRFIMTGAEDVLNRDALSPRRLTSAAIMALERFRSREQAFRSSGQDNAPQAHQHLAFDAPDDPGGAGRMDSEILGTHPSAVGMEDLDEFESDAILVVDADGCVRFASHQAGRMLDIEPELIIGQDATDLLESCNAVRDTQDGPQQELHLDRVEDRVWEGMPVHVTRLYMAEAHD